MQGVVYRKTQQGLAEMVNRSSGLPAKSRQLLIQIDGIKTTDQLITTLSGRELLQALLELEWDGMVEKIAGQIGPVPAPSPAAASLPAPSPAALGSKQLAQIRQIVYISNNTHLRGELDEWIDRVLGQCADHAGLHQCLQHWESLMTHRGHGEVAQSYLQQISAILRR
ncbi:hypothetical protein [Jeongeupia chitinilytica]|uniref:Uncharacterized protein n=1 Tax=Jeongeupia chitinilytica TaxID=1041641 RepID=A0ABQ3GYW8_9NEIS|nr:hypothetical protein [Jeongeupia chitinilytica]GHD61998.1 hypothetical protein GCM10007350_17230 [Jeongeupia chitinilytica]